ncbi:uncharacterized protein TM35_000432040 [Trypanosoma theileri]|uniref:Uncharacterized protein n=1 Tax=Trypanosoma theileri TaxID=67003 RepID=A0A1X0NIY9_9TRYP|nr:uncharacterized protein TM35_000432040 [Trypanosoma theileri]ORC84636.1 hypothetical protein TM35_000432040 [Trypanosoma theileri]
MSLEHCARRLVAGFHPFFFLILTLLFLSSSKSLSMIFHASRFSAPGRKVPLSEPRRSEARRSCQPTHVFSRLERGAKWLCLCRVLLWRACFWSACRAATVLRQEFRPTPLRLGCDPFQDELLGASVYCPTPPRTFAFGECPSPERKS